MTWSLVTFIFFVCVHSVSCSSEIKLEGYFPSVVFEHSGHDKTQYCETEECQQKKVKLECLFKRPDLMLDYQKHGGNQIIFIESSGRDFLDARQACAVESAARSKGEFSYWSTPVQPI